MIARARLLLAAMSCLGLDVGRVCPARADPSLLPAPADFAPALRDDTDVILYPSARRPPQRPAVIAATRTRAALAAVAAVALDPALLRRALPSLVRAEVLATRAGPRPDAWPDRLVAWELEIPLFNLTGKGWLQQRPAEIDFTLVEGAFAPGQLRIRLSRSLDGGGTTIVVCQLEVDASSSNWIFRRVARHDPWSETAMSGATAWTLLRAIVKAAENPLPTARLRPSDPIAPSPATVLDGQPLASPALAALRSVGLLATVRRAANGRLGFTSVAVPIAMAPTALAAQLAAPETWRSFPGWKSVKRVAVTQSAASSSKTPAPVYFEVQDDLALIDLDATWAATAAPTIRATAIAGDIRGAVFGWDVFPGDRPTSALAVLSMHPHLDASGYVERRLIEAEPLLEHGLAAALTYVDAAAVADRLNP